MQESSVAGAWGLDLLGTNNDHKLRYVHKYLILYITSSFFIRIVILYNHRDQMRRFHFDQLCDSSTNYHGISVLFYANYVFNIHHKRSISLRIVVPTFMYCIITSFLNVTSQDSGSFLEY